MLGHRHHLHIEGAPPWDPSHMGLKTRASKQTWWAPTLQMGIQPEKRGVRKNDMGESLFPETDPISLFFRFAYIPFVTHRDKWKFQSHAGVSSPDLYQNQVLHIKVYIKVLGVLHHLLAMRPADILWSFLSDNQKTYFFQGCFFLNQAPPSK